MPDHSQEGHINASPSRTIKGYDLLEPIGEGAYGAVYRARQHFVDRDVAVKIILPEFANQPDFIRRFETEAQLVAQLEHIHIAPLYDYWRDPQGAYLVMRLMKGGSLEDRLRDGSLPLIQVFNILEQVASALTAAHRKGIVHRDLKPANILLDEDGNAYLSDFGIAKAIGAQSGMTLTGAIVGTPAFISPEQVQALPVTPQTDIYSLGVVLYVMLTGQQPFPETSAGDLIARHLRDPLPDLADVSPDLPPELNAIIQTATAKDPADRYPDVGSMLAEFRQVLGPDLAPAPERSITDQFFEVANPYKGLRPFQEADAADFFGRESLVQQLLSKLKEKDDYARFLALVGPSGSGKSSVVKAGLLPALRQGALKGSQDWFFIDITPGIRPLDELEVGLLRVASEVPADLREQLQRDERGLVRAAQRSSTSLKRSSPWRRRQTKPVNSWTSSSGPSPIQVPRSGSS
jgi:serine/threonine protein kinase